MQHEIVLESPYKRSFRADRIAGMFDVKPSKRLQKRFSVDIPIEDDDWNVGLIVGASGSGKSTIAEKMLPEMFDGIDYFTEHNWTDGPIVNDFSKSLEDEQITKMLVQVGFSSPPSWLLPYKALSNGQKFRADMARALLESSSDAITVIDEFTSVVDRNVAQACSYAVSRAVKRNDQKFIAVSCHKDIIDWLEPDWVYDVDEKTFTRGSLWRRPEIKLEIRRESHKVWERFKDHHYLDNGLNKSAHCYVGYINGVPVAFCAVLKQMHNVVKNLWRSSRVVVLPDYQGLGIGTRMSDAIADHYVKDLNYAFTANLSHPALIQHRLNSEKWVCTSLGKNSPKVGKTGKVSMSAHDRLTVSFQYVGSE